jgi:FeS assembly SUF system protein
LEIKGEKNMVTKDQIMQVLREVYDPEIPINIVDLGLIYHVDIQGKNVEVQMTLTAPHCPMAGFLQEDVKRKIEAMKGVDQAFVELVWDPPWTLDRVSQETKSSMGL